MADYIKRESRTFIEIADDLNDLVTELNDKIAETIREKNAFSKNADVAPVRHGRWVESFKVNAPLTLKLRWTCSWCGNVQTYGATDFCPNCGARMDGGDDEID